MTSLQWHKPDDDAPSDAPHKPSAAAGADPWFGIAMGLLGVIAGFALGRFLL